VRRMWIKPEAPPARAAGDFRSPLSEVGEVQEASFQGPSRPSGRWNVQFGSMGSGPTRPCRGPEWPLSREGERFR
jgi:hypothetical protein